MSVLSKISPKASNIVLSIFFILVVIETTTYASTSNQSDTIVTGKELIILGKWNEKQLDHIIRESSKIHDLDIRIDFLSEQFLNVDYKESTLIGNKNTPEVFVINLQGVDCFTYVDYVEAMSLSNSFPEFKDKLRTIRYQFGNIDFLNRNHFFTDWEYFNSEYVDDFTEKIGGDKTKTILKTLNDKNDGTYFIPGISPKKRKIHYIPSDAFDNEMLSKLRSGDYIGIYSNQDGLDVSHVGIAIKEGDTFYFRHASSSEGNRKVVDEDFMNYISDKPGILILRPK
ncbi:MAG: N-acetylmuramoyl-L-alanine amidase-like domain-containing protein [Thermodesulfobacteriota bacterium]